jgi:hypothetical protein
VSRAAARPPTSSTAMAAEGGFAGTATQRTGAGVRSAYPAQDPSDRSSGRDNGRATTRYIALWLV